MGVIIVTAKRLAKRCFEGDVAMPKINLWMVVAICFLTGMVIGLLSAPATYGIIIGSNSGNHSNNTEGQCKKSRK